MKFKNYFFLFLFVIFTSSVFSQPVNVDTVKAGKFDLGKMWTFEHAPVDYFSETYGFRPTQEWLDNVRMSALRFGGGCSASFVSEDGLVMTNHHCGRGYVTQIEKADEKLSVKGFIAQTLEDERKAPNLFVDQLVQIIDVSREVLDAIESGKTTDEKQLNKQNKIKEIETRYSNDLNLRCNVVTLYNGSEYMVYAYKRYTDVRLVFAPENLVAFFGGDPDNFTYPRYDFDCMFFRVYDETGKPLKTSHFFKFSSNGAAPGEPIFVVGNPGSTERLKTVSQLEFARDYTVPARLQLLVSTIENIEKITKENPELTRKYEDLYFGLMNSQKVYNGQLKALFDPVMMAKKKDFEKNLKNAINAKPELKTKYGNAWNDIATALDENKKFYKELSVYDVSQRFSSKYFFASNVISRNALGNKETPDSIINVIYDKFDAVYNRGLLEYEIGKMYNILGKDNAIIKKIFGNRNSGEAVEFVLSNSRLTNLNDALDLIHSGYASIVKSTDPLIMFWMASYKRFDELATKQKEIQARIEINSVLLGRSLFEVYGTSIPPDATFSLRISDGVISSYPYNGTEAQPFTTFYGMYDRYNSFGKKYPWLLPERWANPPAEFHLETPFNFVSTNDIIGGNSGSPLINQNAEIVGLAFDGNIESLPGRYIYTTEANRTVSLDSRALVEAIKNLFKMTRLSDELINGKIK